MKLSEGLPVGEGRDHQAMAPRTGPFPHREFLTAWHEELGQEAQAWQASSDHGELLLMKLSDGTLELLGEGDLCDYHSPLGDLDVADFEIVGEALSAQSHHLSFDSLPAEASEPMANGLAAAGFDPDVRQHQSALVLELPKTVDDFYANLGKKERHELRRKRRRYEESIGKVSLRTHEAGSTAGINEFVRLHRLSPGPKGQFMNGDRERFFRRLAAQPGWRTDLLETPAGASACLFGYSDASGYYLYNSGFDPALAHGSPGLVVLTAMIEHTIEQGLGVFDFLKGDEDYKVRLGASPRPLFVIEARIDKS